MNILYDERVDGALPRVDKAALLFELQESLPDLEILHSQEVFYEYHVVPDQVIDLKGKILAPGSRRSLSTKDMIDT